MIAVFVLSLSLSLSLNIYIYIERKLPPILLVLLPLYGTSCAQSMGLKGLSADAPDEDRDDRSVAVVLG